MTSFSRECVESLVAGAPFISGTYDLAIEFGLSRFEAEQVWTIMSGIPGLLCVDAESDVDVDFDDIDLGSDVEVGDDVHGEADVFNYGAGDCILGG